MQVEHDGGCIRVFPRKRQYYMRQAILGCGHNNNALGLTVEIAVLQVKVVDSFMGKTG